MAAFFVLHSVCVSSAVARGANGSQVYAAHLDPDVPTMGCGSTTSMVRTRAASGVCLLFPVLNPASSVRRLVAAASVYVPCVRARRELDALGHSSAFMCSFPFVIVGIMHVLFNVGKRGRKCQMTNNNNKNRSSYIK